MSHRENIPEEGDVPAKTISVGQFVLCTAIEGQEVWETWIEVKEVRPETSGRKLLFNWDSWQEFYAAPTELLKVK